MPWQPPIPAGALYSKPARQLGPALALLAYCYDLVQRDGWFDLALKDAAGDMEEPYPTVKRWWQTLASGPFFAEVQPRGRLGMRVRFKDVWIDWRILRARPVELFGTEAGSEMIPNVETVIIRDGNGTEAGSEMIPNDNVYKEDQHDHESSSPTQIETSSGDDGDFLKTLIREHGIGAKKAREIVATGVDPETCYQSIRNRVDPKNPHTLGRVILDLVSAPPEKGKPYERPPPPPNGQRPADTRPALPVYQAPTNRPDPQAAAKAIVQAMKGKDSERTT